MNSLSVLAQFRTTVEQTSSTRLHSSWLVSVLASQAQLIHRIAGAVHREGFIDLAADLEEHSCSYNSVIALIPAAEGAVPIVLLSSYVHLVTNIEISSFPMYTLLKQTTVAHHIDELLASLVQTQANHSRLLWRASDQCHALVASSHRMHDRARQVANILSTTDEF